MSANAITSERSPPAKKRPPIGDLDLLFECDVGADTMLLLAMSAVLENGNTLTFVAVSTTQVVFVVGLMAMIGTAGVVVVAVADG